MAVSRFGIASNKKTALMKQQMREIAKLLSEDPPKEEKARIRAEALIRDDDTIEAYEILALSCELLVERLKYVTVSKRCPDDLKSTISTLIWASARVDIKELNDVRKQFRSKYGKEFDTASLNNQDLVVNERVVAKLSVIPPNAFLVQTYLEKIADQFDVDWKPVSTLSAQKLAAPMDAPSGYSVPIAPGTGYATSLSKPNGNFDETGQTNRQEKDIPVVTTVVNSPPPSASTEADLHIPSAPGAKDDNDNSNDNSFDDLQARFARLKR